MSFVFLAGIKDLDVCQDYLEWCGHDVRRPTMFAADVTWTVNNAQAVVLTEGWETVRSAVAMKMVAENCGKEICYYHPDRLHGDRLQEHAVPGAMGNTETLGDTNTGEVRVVNQITGGEKGRKPARFELIPPAALFCTAEVFARGAEKYADRNWERGVDWSLMFGAMMRHMWAWWGGENNDIETGLSHLGHAAFHVLGLIQMTETHPDLDDRPFEGK